jgi:hypothetical protein
MGRPLSDPRLVQGVDAGKETPEGGPPGCSEAGPLPSPSRLPGFEGPGRSLVPWQRQAIGWRERDASTVCGKGASLAPPRFASLGGSENRIPSCLIKT